MRSYTTSSTSHYPGCRVPVFSTIADFCAFHAKRKKLIPTAGGKGVKEVGLGKWWIDHPDRRQYDGIVYAPHGVESFAEKPFSASPRGRER